MTLHQAIQEWATPTDQSPPNSDDLGALLDEVKWEAPLSVTMDIDFRLDKLTPPQAEKLHKLIALATAVQREPEPGTGRSLVFDLSRRVSQEPVTVAEKLFEILGGKNLEEKNLHPFKFFAPCTTGNKAAYCAILPWSRASQG